MVSSNSQGTAVLDPGKSQSLRERTLTENQIANIRSKANEVVASLVGAGGSRAIELGEEISNVGLQDQKKISSGIALLQETMGNLLESNKKTTTMDNVSKDIINLQTTLTKINPKDIKSEARFRILRLVPFFGGWAVNILKVSSQRRQSLQQFVDHLEESLKSGEIMLRQDNAQLLTMYTDIEEKQHLINSDAYLAEALMDNLTKVIAETTDERKKNGLNKVLFRVATRAQDLRAMENVHEQFFTSIEMTRDNNETLVLTIQRMLTMGMNVVYIAFAIYAALARQKNVIEAARGTKEFIGNMIVSNATMVNNHVTEIGDLYKDPIIALDKLQTAIDQLSQAIDATNKMKAEGIQRARENTVKIKMMTEELQTKSNSLPTSEVKSIEASKVLLLASPK